MVFNAFSRSIFWLIIRVIFRGVIFNILNILIIGFFLLLVHNFFWNNWIFLGFSLFAFFKQYWANNAFNCVGSLLSFYLNLGFFWFTHMNISVFPLSTFKSTSQHFSLLGFLVVQFFLHFINSLLDASILLNHSKCSFGTLILLLFIF